jgi:hypothetical protein
VENLTEEITHNTTVFKDFMTDLNLTSQLLDKDYKATIVQVKAAPKASEDSSTTKDNSKTDNTKTEEPAPNAEAEEQDTKAPDVEPTERDNISDDEDLNTVNDVDASVISELPVLELIEDAEQEQQEEQANNKANEETIKEKVKRKGTTVIEALKDKVINLFYPSDVHFESETGLVKDRKGDEYMVVGQGLRAVATTRGDNERDVRLMAPLRSAKTGEIVPDKWIQVAVISKKDTDLTKGGNQELLDLYEASKQLTKEQVFNTTNDITSVLDIPANKLFGKAFNVKEKTSLKFNYIGKTEDNEAKTNPNNHTFDNAMTRAIYVYEQGMLQLPNNQKHTIVLGLTKLIGNHVVINPEAMKKGLISI